MTNKERTIWTISALIIAFVVGIIIGMSIPSSTAPDTASTQEHTTADITVMPCSAWNDGANPTIPDNTLTDACVDERGTLHTAPTSMDKTR